MMLAEILAVTMGMVIICVVGLVLISIVNGLRESEKEQTEHERNLELTAVQNTHTQYSYNIVKVKCQYCRTLNDEVAVHCMNCGAKI